VLRKTKIEELTEELNRQFKKVTEDPTTTVGNIVYKTGLITLILIFGVTFIGICFGLLICAYKVLKCLFILPAKKRKTRKARKRENTHTSLSELDYRLPYPYEDNVNDITRV